MLQGFQTSIIHVHSPPYADIKPWGNFTICAQNTVYALTLALETLNKKLRNHRSCLRVLLIWGGAVLKCIDFHSLMLWWLLNPNQTGCAGPSWKQSDSDEPPRLGARPGACRRGGVQVPRAARATGASVIPLHPCHDLLLLPRCFSLSS